MKSIFICSHYSTIAVAAQGFRAVFCRFFPAFALFSNKTPGTPAAGGDPNSEVFAI